MLNLIEMALNNNVVYITIIIVLLIIIFITIRSIKKDRDAYKKVVNNYEPAKTEQERMQAKFELEKVVDEMQKNLDKKDQTPKPPMKEEEDMVISYEELVKAVKNNDIKSEPRNDVGMEVADTTFIEEADDDIFIDEELPEPKEEKSILDELIEEKLDKDASEEVAADIEDTINIENDIKNYEPKEESSEIEFKEEPIEQTRPYEAYNFKSTEFISPVFGKDISTDTLVNMNKEETITSEDDLDMEEEDEFLNSLRNFRKKL